MDIRKFFGSLKRKKTDGSSSDSDEQYKVKTISHVSSSVTTTTTGYIQPQELPSSSRYLAPNPDSLMDDCNENDIGRYVGRAHMLSAENKKELIENCWSPSATYNFAEDAKHLKRISSSREYHLHPIFGIMELQCKVQKYDWGKLGQTSMVAKLLSSADPNYAIEVDKPYAELWMGTHPNGPSLLTERNILLSDYIKNNVDAIGPAVKKQFGVAVPFLLKVLSIRKALSIQAHPKKEHAEELHQNFPDMYKDPNHKPELAIALTPFKALCGFRPLSEIQQFLKKLPEITEILDKESMNSLLANEQSDSQALKNVFHSLMTCDKTKISASLQSLLNRLVKEDASTQAFLLYPVLHRLHTDFPGDVGCIGPFFMNYLQLQPGQAIFLNPNLPHAYLSGDCIECMACSDNVVRAGLTPKHIDVPTLLDMLDYNSYTKDQLLFSPTLEDENTCIWRPPIPDFAVVKIKVESGDSYNTINRPSPSIIIITSGSGEVCDTEPIKARPGVVIFLKASRQLTLTPNDGNHLELYQAICNV